MTEQEIITRALDNLQKQTHIQGLWDPAVQKELDGKVIFNLHNTNLRYFVDIKKELRNHHLHQIYTLNQKYFPIMVVAGRIFPKIKEELRNQNIAYLEANGNIFLKHKRHLLWIDANKPVQAEVETANRAFTKTGLRVLFEFLLDETWLNKPYRQIAERTGTGIGNITNIINGLKKDGYLLHVEKNKYKLNNKPALLNEWAIHYNQKLKPSLKIGRFRFLDAQDFNRWKKMHLLPGKTWWGGEPAGELYTKYLRPAELTLYTDETHKELIKNYKLIPDENGNVTAYRRFWKYDDIKWDTDFTAKNIVPPLLVYADLINTNDRRCIETAQKIYDEFLQS